MPKILIVTGATASGKSAHALCIAEDLAKQNQKPVIINADSQQLYAELRILTARPTSEEEARFPHRLYGILPAAQGASAGAWLRLAKMEIDWTLAQDGVPIVVGGTGLYIKALLHGMSDMPDIAPEVRAQAVGDYEQMGKAAFSERLREVDPEFFARLSVYDRQRLIRAWEVWLGSGKPLSWWQGQQTIPLYPSNDFQRIPIDIPREELYRRCDARFAAMVEQGAVEEVKQLQALGLSQQLSAMKSVGIKELGAYLRGEMQLEDAIKAAQQATRNFAKRQLTWFRHQMPSG